MKIGNTIPRAGLEPTSLTFQASVLPQHHLSSLMSPLYPGKIGNTMPRAELEPTSLTFQAFVLPFHHITSLMSPLYPGPPGGDIRDQLLASEVSADYYSTIMFSSEFAKYTFDAAMHI